MGVSERTATGRVAVAVAVVVVAPVVVVVVVVVTGMGKTPMVAGVVMCCVCCYVGGTMSQLKGFIMY
ncbi:hypothetical protein E2C01_046376 [Portunus trituberculatus]|uniref:Transmembrane protein n=1 Tax=Portunus trituberculatus TaxID=210409 RepID=A0A5B7G514_PORTR|nr:hypothetical protein [Portunus trituberculatus]